MKRYAVLMISIGIIFFIFSSADANATKPASDIDDNKPISLNLRQVPVREVLQLLAEMHNLNIVMSDAVKGDMTIDINNIPWQKALAVILQEQGLSSQRMDNVLIIMPLSEIAARNAQQLAANEAIQKTASLVSAFIPVKYGKAEDIAAMLTHQNSHLLSPRGNITVDTRTNMLWVQDTADKLIAIQNFVHDIDIPVKQVLIEARIVSVDEKYEQELGVRFGLTRPNNNISGTFQGANALAKDATAISNPLDRLNVDLPALGAGTPGGASTFGLALATLGGGTLLDLELSALETEGGGEILSSPRLITGNRQPATILSGQEIPYQSATLSGATSVSFQKAVLRLTVTPRITPDNQLMLDLQVNQDHPTATVVQGVPAIETRQIQTQVLVNNAETIVLGGIYEENHQKQVQRVPFLGDLPLLGHLFRHSVIKQNRRELLIFITPHILFA